MVLGGSVMQSFLNSSKKRVTIMFRQYGLTVFKVPWCTISCWHVGCKPKPIAQTWEAQTWLDGGGPILSGMQSFLNSLKKSVTIMSRQNGFSVLKIPWGNRYTSSRHAGCKSRLITQTWPDGGPILRLDTVTPSQLPSQIDTRTSARMGKWRSACMVVFWKEKKNGSKGIITFRSKDLFL